MNSPQLLTIALFSAFAVSATQAAPCPARPSQVLYSADFRQPSHDPNHVDRNSPPLRLSIARLPGSAKPVAWIHSPKTGACQATCQITAFERDRADRPVSLELSCEGVALNSLKSPATLLWAEHSAFTFPTLRFGTWLHGYQHARLQVSLDRFLRQTPTRARAAAPQLPPRPARAAAPVATPAGTPPQALRALPAGQPRQGSARRRPTRMYAASQVVFPTTPPGPRTVIG